jgi:hypothetical protein
VQLGVQLVMPDLHALQKPCIAASILDCASCGSLFIISGAFGALSGAFGAI